jgi:hypothetical protein
MPTRKRRRVNLRETSCNIYRDLLAVAAKLRRKGYLRRFQGDLIRHDKRDLRGYCGPYLWAIRGGGTHLLTPERMCAHGGDKSFKEIAAGKMYPKSVFGTDNLVFFSKNGEKPHQVRNPQTVANIIDGWRRRYCKP